MAFQKTEVDIHEDYTVEAVDPAWLAHGVKSPKHLMLDPDNCILCRACEDVCPSHVPFGRLMERARAQVEPDGAGEPGDLFLGEARLAQPGQPVVVGTPRAHRADVRHVGEPQRDLEEGDVELGVVGEHADGVAWSQGVADPLEQAVRIRTGDTDGTTRVEPGQRAR
mgnify:CR=1 FL=1